MHRFADRNSQKQSNPSSRIKTDLDIHVFVCTYENIFFYCPVYTILFTTNSNIFCSVNVKEKIHSAITTSTGHIRVILCRLVYNFKKNAYSPHAYKRLIA